MKKNMPLKLFMLAAASLLLAACTTIRPDAATLFDFGSLPSKQGTPLQTLPPISIAGVTAPSWLDRPLMFYRLGYANDQQARFYSQSRWTAAPAQLLAQRLKARLSQAGGIILPPPSSASGSLSLHIEITDFLQVFTSPQQSAGHVGLRASLFNGHTLIAQKTFARQAPAPSADAAGAANAMTIASDAALTDLIAWLNALPVK